MHTGTGYPGMHIRVFLFNQQNFAAKCAPATLLATSRKRSSPTFDMADAEEVPESCPGTQSENAGKASACAGSFPVNPFDQRQNFLVQFPLQQIHDSTLVIKCPNVLRLIWRFVLVDVR